MSVKKPTAKFWPFEEQSRDIFCDLTEKEKQVCAWIYAGFQDKEIAEKFGIDTGTVRQRIERIFHKTGCRSRLQIALLVERAMRFAMTDDVAAALRRQILDSVTKSVKDK